MAAGDENGVERCHTPLTHVSEAFIYSYACRGKASRQPWGAGIEQTGLHHPVDHGATTVHVLSAPSQTKWRPAKASDEKERALIDERT